MGKLRVLLPIVQIPGLTLDSLGNYLASVGLLRALARAPGATPRASWRDGVFQIVGGPSSVDEVVEALWSTATKRNWVSYEREWAEAQKQSTKNKSGRPLAIWLASAAERELEMLNAHVVPASRLSFNPMLGSGGNAGKRDFSDGWARAVEALRGGSRSAEDIRLELKCLLAGDPVAWIVEKLNAASWFSDTNKLYNSGQRPDREGAISPWAMALACEGLPFFGGGPSRRLGARARTVGAFPFVTRAAAPTTGGELGHDSAEIWAPVWERPMTLPEVKTLFSRGRAEVDGRRALTPGAFSVAVLQRGVDSGITELRRFILARTTSANTFEPRFAGAYQIRKFDSAQRTRHPASLALGRVLSLVDQFVGPLSDKTGRQQRYVGLRGTIERGMLRLAASPEDSEAGCSLLDAIVASLDRIDRNKTFRERDIAWKPLPLGWLLELFGEEEPEAEARLALALASSFPANRPFTLYRFGVVQRGDQFAHPAKTPKHWVWRSSLPVPMALSDTLFRRTLDMESERERSGPTRPGVPAGVEDVDSWLAGRTDNELLVRWLSRLALFDWRSTPYQLRSLARSTGIHSVDGAISLFGLLQPLFDERPVRKINEPASNLFQPDSSARTPAAARRLLGLLRIGDVASAVRFAGTRYAVAGAPLVRHDAPWHCGNVETLTSSLLFSISDRERSILVGRWLRPRRKQGETTHVA